MELFILAYRRNEKLCYTKKPYTLFEKIFFVSVLIMTACIFFAVILQNIYGSNIYGCIAFVICAVCLFMIYPIVESLVYKNTYYYQKIKTTILDYMLTKEYETMD